MKPIKNLFAEMYLAIEVQITEEGYIYHYLILKRTGNDLRIVSSGHDVKDFEQVKKNIQKGSRIIITINGKGVLVRKVKHDEDPDKEGLVSKVLPNAKSHDFIIETSPINKDQAFVCLVRKELANELINLFEKDHCFVLRVIPGPLQIKHVLPLMEFSGQKLFVGDYKYLLNEGKILDCTMARYRKGEQIIPVAGEQINEKLLVAFAGCFEYITSKGEVQKDLPELTLFNKNMRFYDYYSKGRIAVIAVLFLALLINYLIFDNLNKNNKSLSNEVSSFEGIISNIEQLQEKLSTKKQLVDEAGLRSTAQFSYYTDRIAQSMPEEILLEEILVFPVKKDKRTRQLSFISRRIQVKGKLQNPSGLNNWIERLKQNDWIEEVRIIRFNHDNKKDVSDFEIEITII